MRILLSLLLSTLPFACVAQVKDWSAAVDRWTKECDDGACNLALIKNIRGAKSESDWFALGLSLSSAGNPNYFVFSYPPTSVASQVVLSFVTLDRQAAGFKPTVAEIASFTAPPCERRQDCQVRFDAAIVPATQFGSYSAVNIWQALQSRNLLDVQQIFESDGSRAERGMLVALPAFQQLLKELDAK
ncbi:hypothetical protein [Roseateles sp. BYS87W]|uniref:Uncharacterized protein n=1 Tax=Pelomonas baiyunensis TaxID=3299026 RepID=A0ABW7H222_9BURK